MDKSKKQVDNQETASPETPYDQFSAFKSFDDSYIELNEDEPDSEDTEEELFEEDEDSSEETDSEDTGEEEQEAEEDTVDESAKVEAVDPEHEKLEKRYKETRDWATRVNEKAVKSTKQLAHAIMKMRENGEEDTTISEILGVPADDLDKMVNGEDVQLALASDPVAVKAQKFFEQYEPVKEVIKDTLGKDPDERIKAVDLAMRFDPQVREDFLASENSLKFIFGEEGRRIEEEYSDFMKADGNIIKAYKETKSRVQELEEQLAALKSLKSDVESEHEPGDEAEIASDEKPRRRKLTGSKKSIPSEASETSSKNGFKLYSWE